MSKPQKDKLLDHNYDGIQELDNPLPGWWVNLFHATTIFAVIYLFVFFFFMKPAGVRAEEEVKKLTTPAPKAAVAETKTESAETPAATAADEPVFEHDEDTLAAGKKIFVAKCVACHNPHGEGLVGPNLTDKYWIHGKGTEKDIYTVVTNGVPEKGMITWKTQLSDEDIRSVVVYVKSLQGTNPENPKAPQGELVE